MLTRRRFLQGAAVLALSAGCRSDRGTARRPESRPTTTLPEGTDTIPATEPIVVLMMENRPFLQAGTAAGLIRNVQPTINDRPPPNGTIWDRLNAHGIDWANYYVDLPEIGLFPSVYLANSARARPVDQYLSAARAGTLPAVSLVPPKSTGSEENPQDIQQGEAFAASIINAALDGPAWPKTLLIWTYDEHGGYYDHVSPPAAVP